MSKSPADLPEFNNPPVVETVLGVQFAPIAGFTSAHYGWYWKLFLDDTWIKSLEAPLLPEITEQFGEKMWGRPTLSFLTPATPDPDRIQFVNEADDRVIQIQNNRFIYNWRKREAAYPRFAGIYSEFKEKLDSYRRFLRGAGFGDISPNLWEITYISHIPKGELWSTTEDWCRVFPGLYSSNFPSGGVRFENTTGAWVFEIVPQLGRLHVTSRHGRLPEGQEVVMLDLTARGQISQTDPTEGLERGFDLGHRVAVKTFADMSSDTARKHWGG